MSSRIDVIRNRWEAPSDHTKPYIRMYADREWQLKAALEDIPYLLAEVERLRDGLRQIKAHLEIIIPMAKKLIEGKK